VAVALEGEDVGGDAVEEPAVVAEDARAAAEEARKLIRVPAPAAKANPTLTAPRN